MLVDEGNLGLDSALRTPTDVMRLMAEHPYS